jgi:hypothetical protein
MGASLVRDWSSESMTWEKRFARGVFGVEQHNLRAEGQPEEQLTAAVFIAEFLQKLGGVCVGAEVLAHCFDPGPPLDDALGEVWNINGGAAPAA